MLEVEFELSAVGELLVVEPPMLLTALPNG
jgi:hypothetical protein